MTNQPKVSLAVWCHVCGAAPCACPGLRPSPDRSQAIRKAGEDFYASECKRLGLADPMTLAEARRIQAETHAKVPGDTLDKDRASEAVQDAEEDRT